MRENDLDNRPMPRDVLVFEDLLGILPNQEAKRRLDKALRKRRWKQAVDCFDINDMMGRKIWDLTWRHGGEVDLVTHLGQEFAEELEKRIDRENIPVSRVWFEAPRSLGRRLVVAPDIRHVYFPNSDHTLIYGSRGKLLRADQYNMLGAM